jgi:hypothetical protein
MQATPQPQAATAPVQATTPARSITTVGPDGKPQTLTIPASSGELRELLTQRQELNEQLTNVSSRRARLAEQVGNSGDGVTRAGLEDRLRLLDQRILQLETDLALTGRQIALAPSELVDAAYVSRQGDGDDFEEGMMIGGFTVLFFTSVVFFFVRRRWKRRARAIPAQAGESGQRLQRLEDGMDAIAIEIERISEGQRFVTRLLSESQSPLGAQNRIAQPAGAERSVKP